MRRIWASKTGVTLILDGLNAATGEQAGPFITQLAKLVRDATLPIDTIIVSSTPKPHINAEMQRANLRDVVKIVRIEEYDSPDDVNLSLRQAFDTMRSSHRISASCPDERDLSTLVELTSGSFASATALVNMINKGHRPGRLSLLFSMLRGDVSYVWETIERQIPVNVDQAEACTRGLQYLYTIIDLVEELANPKLRKVVGVDVTPYLRPFSALQLVSPTSSLNPAQIYSTSLQELMTTYTPATREKVKNYNKCRHLSTAKERESQTRRTKGELCNTMSAANVLPSRIRGFLAPEDQLFSIRHTSGYGNSYLDRKGALEGHRVRARWTRTNH
ncbi:hypothetical protein CONPUDRAFT_144311, partial [Coniophora puteana RWD-64-598 SS2]